MSTRVEIAPGHWLFAPAAASWARMRAAGMPSGGITEAGRTRERQEYLYAQYLAGKLLAYAARPGSSKHEGGRAVDMKTASAAHAWLIAHGAEHGWTRPLLRATKPEPWHWEYSAILDRHLTDEATPVAPITPLPVEDDVLIITAPDRPAALVGPGFFRELRTDEEVAAAGSLANKTVTGNARQWDVWRDLVLTGQTPDPSARAVAAEVWRYQMDGGPTMQPGSATIPRESAGERLRQVRRQTQNLRGRTITIADAVTPTGDAQPVDEA